jgi:hypothetical protein
MTADTAALISFPFRLCLVSLSNATQVIEQSHALIHWQTALRPHSQHIQYSGQS